MVSFSFYQDSLWAAEDINAVFDQYPRRVAILQGTTVAVKHARVANRPIKEMLGGVEDYIIKRLLEGSSINLPNGEDTLSGSSLLLKSRPNTRDHYVAGIFRAIGTDL